MTPEYADKILNHLFGGGASPQAADDYFVRLFIEDGTEVDVTDWVDYAPQPIDRATEFNAAASGTGGRRESVGNIEILFTSDADIPGSDVILKYVALCTTDDDTADVVSIQLLPSLRAVADGDTVKIPIGRLISFLSPSSLTSTTLTLNP